MLRSSRFDIAHLTERLQGATRWVDDRPDVGDLSRGYFGASTGAAAALRAAADPDVDVDAIVSRGGRVDLAEAVADRVRAPSLFVVGGEDTDVLRMNEETIAEMTCHTELAVVEGAGHLFEGEGELDEVADLAADWFVEHLR
ncbi:MAG: dienelactone hydrolase family protein [Halobacteriaceae archaeon]